MDEQSVIKAINEYLAKWPSLKISDFMQVSQMTTREGCLKSTNWNRWVYG